ncbi:SIMPL domain-containing protein [Brevundimonas sp.]|uniref:SIMPL domain-containing protein n=1 Tax=Brevundimonas sp. TaxID=1871086 RepID=UPI0025F0A578|nr:SIMPL domain-containing protein [Brevundimonas sp.]
MKALLRASAVALVLAAGAPIAAQAQTAGDHHAHMAVPTFSLSAQGEVRVAPDMATITTGVQTEARTAQEAMAQNRAQMNQVIAALRRAGIEERHIQTSSLNLSAVYDYPPNQQPSLRGYQASNQVTVQVHDLADLGQAVDAVVAAGANQIHGISFGLADPSVAEDAARREAVRILQQRAQLYADATGMRLVVLRSLSEGGGYVAPPPMPMYRAEMAMAQDGGSTPVQGGELVVRVDITGVYEVSR